MYYYVQPAVKDPRKIKLAWTQKECLISFELAKLMLLHFLYANKMFSIKFPGPVTFSLIFFKSFLPVIPWKITEKPWNFFPDPKNTMLNIEPRSKINLMFLPPLILSVSPWTGLALIVITGGQSPLRIHTL